MAIQRPPALAPQFGALVVWWVTDPSPKTLPKHPTLASPDAFIQNHQGSEHVEEIVRLSHNGVAVTYTDPITEKIVIKALRDNGLLAVPFDSVADIQSAFTIQNKA